MSTKQKEKSEATKGRLIECAERLFYEKGFDATAVREIVKAAGVAQGTFYLYFETKYDVLAEIYKNVFGAFHGYIGALDIENPKFDDIALLIDVMVDYMRKNPGLIRLLHDADVVKLMNIEKYELLSSWMMQSAAEKWIENACKTGLISSKAPKLYARMISQIAHELLESSCLYGYPDTIDVVKEEVKLIIRKILE